MSEIYQSKRPCEPRWKLIEPVLGHPDTVLDLGCAEGYFTRQAAKIGAVAIGIDNDSQRFEKLGLEPNVGFIWAEITPSLLKHFEVDTTFCLSLLHHIIYSKGLAYAKELVSSIKTKRLFFEMGTGKEKKHGWSEIMPEGDEWITDFLKSCGYDKITKLGETPAYYPDYQRSLFLAERF